MNDSVTQKKLWLQYMNAISNQVDLESGEALQLIYPYTPWDWGGRDPVENSYSYNQWLTLNVVPSDPVQNANADAAASQSGFDRAYRSWFDHLAIGDLQHDEHYKELQDQLTNAENKYDKDYQSAKNIWKNQTGGNGPSFSKWLNQPGQAGTQMQIAEDKKNMVAAQSQLDEYRSNIQSPIKKIQDDFNNTDYQNNVTDPNSGKSVPVRIWATIPTNPYKHVEEITNNSFGSNATKGNASEFQFSSESKEYDYESTYGGGGFLVDDDFIMVEGEAGYEKIQWSNFASEYEISVHMQDLVSVEVKPDQWYAGTDSLAKGPYATGFSEFGSGGGNYFFGPGGSLSRKYTRLIAGYRPTITISASSSFATYMKEKWEQESGIMIGPFFFGSEAQHTKTKSTLKVENGKIIISSQADWPMIMGMASSWTVPPED